MVGGGEIPGRAESRHGDRMATPVRMSAPSFVSVPCEWQGGHVPLAEVLGAQMRRPPGYSPGLVSRLSGVPKATIVNWLELIRYQLGRRRSRCSAHPSGTEGPATSTSETRGHGQHWRE